MLQHRFIKIALWSLAAFALGFLYCCFDFRIRFKDDMPGDSIFADDNLKIIASGGLLSICGILIFTVMFVAIFFAANFGFPNKLKLIIITCLLFVLAFYLRGFFLPSVEVHAKSQLFMAKQNARTTFSSSGLTLEEVKGYIKGSYSTSTYSEITHLLDSLEKVLPKARKEALDSLRKKASPANIKRLLANEQFQKAEFTEEDFEGVTDKGRSVREDEIMGYMLDIYAYGYIQKKEMIEETTNRYNNELIQMRFFPFHVSLFLMIGLCLGALLKNLNKFMLWVIAALLISPVAAILPSLARIMVERKEDGRETSFQSWFLLGLEIIIATVLVILYHKNRKA